MPQANSSEDDFQRELLGLFAVEAYEWLEQILAALLRLEEVAEPASATDALDAIVRGLTSLGGSAATVDLPSIQEAVFGLLPVTEQLRANDGPAPSELLAKLRQALGQITQSVAESTGTASIVSFDAPKADLRRAKDFLQALQTLRHTQTHRSPLDRRMAEMIIKRVQRDLDRGVSQVDGQGIRQCFEEMQRSEDDLVSRIQEAIPAIASAVSALKTTSLQPTAVSNAQWKSLLDTLDQLVELARQRQALSIMSFLQGLSAFVRIVIDRRMAMTENRFELVETRVHSLVAMAREWGEAGRQERDAIAHLVPV